MKENYYERRANFRGRPKHAPGGWVYGCLERHWYQGQYSYYIVDDDGNETLTDPSSICQDTGMVDDYCNGIWEGDVLDDHDSGEHYMVYWDERLGMWAVKETTTGFTMSLFRFLQTSDAERSEGNP